MEWGSGCRKTSQVCFLLGSMTDLRPHLQLLCQKGVRVGTMFLGKTPEPPLHALSPAKMLS